jgi:hypothetical protein
LDLIWYWYGWVWIYYLAIVFCLLYSFFFFPPFFMVPLFLSSFGVKRYCFHDFIFTSAVALLVLPVIFLVALGFIDYILSYNSLSSNNELSFHVKYKNIATVYFCFPLPIVSVSIIIYFVSMYYYFALNNYFKKRL